MKMDRGTTLLYYENGTIHSSSEEDPVPAAVSSLIIAICFFLAAIYNFIVITAVFSSCKLRNSLFHVAYASLSSVCLIDCLTNETVALVVLFVEPFGFCVTSAVFFHLFLLVHSSSLGLLCVERTLSQMDCNLSLKTFIGGLFIAWSYGLVFSSPFLGNPAVHYFPNRNSCSAVGSNNLLPLVTLIGLVLCWGIVIFCISLYLFFAYTSHKQEKQSFNLSVLPVFNVSRRSLNLNTNPEKDKLTCTVIFLYVILILPLSISVVVELFLTPVFIPDPWSDPRKSYKVRSVATHSMESLFTYSRYMYNASVPIMILMSDREVRMIGRSIFCCKRNEVAVINSSETESQSKTLAPEPIASDTPVLFATSEGIFLSVSQKAVLPDEKEASTSGVDMKLLSTFCDSSSATMGEKKSLMRIEEKEHVENVPDKFNSRLDFKPRSFSPPVEVSSSSNTHTANSPLQAKESLVSQVHSGRTYSKL